MIGNDVIDLALARKESNWKRKGFLDKLFTVKEQSTINDAENPETEAWRLWSRKEAVYKIYNRESGFRGFIPLQIECHENGKVSCNGNLYFTRTVVSDDRMITVAVSQQEHFKRIVYLPNREEVVKIGQIPYLKKSFNPVSISHHGRFVQIVTLE